MRFVLVPALVAMASVNVVASSDELTTQLQRYSGYALAMVMLLLALGGWDPVRHRWAVRVFAPFAAAGRRCARAGR